MSKLFQRLLFAILPIFFSGLVAAQQGVAINTDGTAPNSSALLDVKSTTKGILVPRMTTVQRTAIVSPLKGLLVFDNTTSSFWFYNGSGWQELTGNGSSEWLLSNNNIYNNNAGNVGIGINVPLNKLDVGGNVRFFSSNMPTLKMESSDLFLSSRIAFNNGTGTTLAALTHVAGSIELRSGSHNNQLIVANSGGVGIGSGSVGAKLDINATGFSGNALRINDDNPTLQMQNAGVDKGFIQLSGDNLRIGTNSSNSSGRFVVRTGGGDRMFVDSDGNVSIGSSLIAGGYKLNVDGKVICEELKVQLSGAWPDYVFKNDYKLITIPELEKYIAENGHLPGIPKASVVESEGISVGDMQKRMMEKIEELTLYIIELKKEIDLLKEVK